MEKIMRIDEMARKVYSGNQGIILSKIDRTFEAMNETSDILANEIKKKILETEAVGELLFSKLPSEAPEVLFDDDDNNANRYTLYSLAVDGNSVVCIAENGAEMDILQLYFTDIVKIYKTVCENVDMEEGPKA